MRLLFAFAFISLLGVPPLLADEGGLPESTLFYSSVSGIGALFGSNDGQTVVKSLISDSPAERAGMKPHDTIVQIDDKKVAGMELSKVVNLVRGEAGTVVKITVLRKGEPLSFSITRAIMRVRHPNSVVSPQGTTP